MQLSTSLTSLLAGTLLSACAAISPGARYVPPTPGTTYVQEFNDSGSYGKGRTETPGAVVSREWNGVRMIGFQTAQNTLLMSLGGAFHAQLSPGMLVKNSLRRTDKSPQGPGTREAVLKEYRAK